MLELIEKGGVLLYPILVCSILTVAVTLERLYRFGKNLEAPAFFKAVVEAAKSGQPEQALQLSHNKKSPGAVVTRTILEQPEIPAEQLEKWAHLEASKVLKKLHKNLHILELIGRISPMMGLFGTVAGMVGAFQSIAIGGGTIDPAMLADGIWQALLTTVAGLAVGIPSLIIHHFFAKTLQSKTIQLKQHTAELILLLKEQELKAG